MSVVVVFFFFNDTATTESYTYCHTLSLHDALPISMRRDMAQCDRFGRHAGEQGAGFLAGKEVQTTLLNVAQARREAVAEEGHETEHMVRCSTCIGVDRKSTRLNSSH